MNSFVSLAVNTNVVELNALDDGYEYEVVDLATARELLPEDEVSAMNEELACVNFNKRLASVAGAVAVSVYKHAGFDVAFDSVKNLADAGMTQINLHFMISGRTIDDAYRVTEAMKTDPRLANVNAIVFLSLKQKGRGVKHDYVSQEQYKALVDHCLATDTPFGFDSCSAPSFLNAVKDSPNYDKFKELSEDCESTLFSSYINEKGEFFPCSFTEGWTEGGWGMDQGINVLTAENFVDDVWNHPRVVEFRNALIANKDTQGCRNCPAYQVCQIDMRLEKTKHGYVPAKKIVGDIEVVAVS